MRPLFLLLARAVLALGLWSGAMPAFAGERVITRALFAPTEQGPWQTVGLPDTWAARGLKGSGRGVYHASFELDAAPEVLWALRAQRLSTHHHVRVNGQLVSGSVMAFAAPHGLRVALDAQPAHERRASLIITDQRLPGGSGLDVIELARRRFGTLPALVVTGNTSPQEIPQLSASGARVLHKPFRAEELLGAIRALLQPS